MSPSAVARAVFTVSWTLAIASPRFASAQPTRDGDDRVTKDSAADSDTVKEDADDGASLGAEADVCSRFIWRGLAFGDGPVLQPSGWASLYGFTASVWANAMLTDSNVHSRVTSLVSTLSYTYETKHVRLAPAFILYYSPTNDGPQSTGEGSLEAALKLGDFQLLTTQFVDIASTRGAYFGTLGPAYERQWKRFTLKASVDVGWANATFNHFYFRWREGGANVAESSVALRYDLTDTVYVGVHGEASTLLSDHLRRQVTSGNLARAGLLIGFEL